MGGQLPYVNTLCTPPILRNVFQPKTLYVEFFRLIAPSKILLDFPSPSDFFSAFIILALPQVRNECQAM